MAWKVAVGIVALAGLGFGALCYASGDTGKIFPNTYVGDVNVGGMTRQEAARTLEADSRAAYEGKTVTLEFPGGGVELSMDQLAPKLDGEAAAEAAYQYGRGGGAPVNAITYLKSLISGVRLEPEFTMNTAYVEQAIAKGAKDSKEDMLPYSYEVSENKLLLTKGRTGKTIDEDAVLERIREELKNRSFDPIPCEPVMTEPEPIQLAAVKQAVYIAPENAYYDSEDHEVVPHVTGVDFDLEDVQKRLDAAKPGEVVTVPLTLTEPELTTRKLEGMLFKNVLGECTTSVGGTASRASNVKLAASFLNGQIIGPGETFSYNETVGKRTTARGFQAAPAYVNGLTVDEIGGGVCQVSSTLYLATLRSNLEIVARAAHTYRVAYMPYGMDATVSWGGPDYKFKNDTEYPIRISAKMKDRALTIQLVGTKTDNTTVKMEYKLLDTIPYQTLRKADNSLQPGQSKVDVTGYTGYKVESYRCIYDENGKLISRKFEASSNYKKRDKIILEGPVPASATPEVSDVPAASPTETAIPEASDNPGGDESAGTDTPQQPGDAVTPQPLA